MSIKDLETSRGSSTIALTAAKNRLDRVKEDTKALEVKNSASREALGAEKKKIKEGWNRSKLSDIAAKALEAAARRIQKNNEDEEKRIKWISTECRPSLTNGRQHWKQILRPFVEDQQAILRAEERLAGLSTILPPQNSSTIDFDAVADRMDALSRWITQHVLNLRASYAEEKKQHQESVSCLKSELKMRMNDLQTANSRHEQDESRYHGMHKSKLEAEQLVKGAEQLLLLERAKNGQLSDELTSSETEISELKGQLASSTTELTVLKDQLASSSTEISGLKASLEEIKDRESVMTADRGRKRVRYSTFAEEEID